MPQRQKTSPIIDATDLPDLTAQQMEFVHGILDGKTATAAYRAAYNCSAMATTTVWTEASKLRSDPKVSRWIDASKIAGLGSTKITFERHINELERIKVLCEQSGNMGAALGCEQTIGKAAGLHIERIADVTADLDPSEILRRAAREHGDDFAKQLATKSGMTWPLPGKSDQPDSHTIN